MNQEYVFSFCRLEILDAYAVITCDEGVHINFDEVQEVAAVLLPAIHGKRFGLIANRENQYSVNPLAINKLFSDECLVAGAIVGNKLTTKFNAEIENESVAGAPIKFFSDMTSAIKWINEKILCNKVTD